MEIHTFSKVWGFLGSSGWSEIGPKLTQGGPKMAKDGVKMRGTWLEMAQDADDALQDAA